jgi:hypothetical protein
MVGAKAGECGRNIDGQELPGRFSLMPCQPGFDNKKRPVAVIW